MNNFIRNLFNGLLENEMTIKIANKIFIYFPQSKIVAKRIKEVLKEKVIIQSVHYESYILDNIKKEVERRRLDK